MLDAVLGMPSDCRSAYDSARQVDQLPSPEGVASVTFCGMGGSAVSGDVVRSVFLERLGLPVEVNRSPVLPEHCDSHTLVVCSSYSGNTAETLTAFRTALGRGCRVLVVTSGGTIADEAAEHGIATVRVPPGFQPRAALGHLGFASLGALETMGILPPLATDVTEAVDEIQTRADRDGAGRSDREQSGEGAGHEDRRSLPGHLGRRRHRFRGRRALEDPDERERQGARVLVLDVRAGSQRGRRAGQSRSATGSSWWRCVTTERIRSSRTRFPLSYDIVRAGGGEVEEVHARGTSALARLMSLVIIGDLTSVYLAIGRGVDPTPVPVIERLKAALAGS